MVRKNFLLQSTAMRHFLCLLIFTAGCTAEPRSGEEQRKIRVPSGFRLTVVADDLGPARHLVVRENGDIYVAMRQRHRGGGIVALRDTDNDGKMDRVERFGQLGGTGIRIYNDYLSVRGRLWRVTYTGD